MSQDVAGQVLQDAGSQHCLLPLQEELVDAFLGALFQELAQVFLQVGGGQRLIEIQSFIEASVFVAFVVEVSRPLVQQPAYSLEE